MSIAFPGSLVKTFPKYMTVAYLGNLRRGMSFEEEIALDLQSPNPPSTELITALQMMMDTEFMIAMLKNQKTALRSRRRSRGRRSRPLDDVASISNNPSHPYHGKVKFAFNYANSIRIKYGFPADPWPLPPSQPPPVERSRPERNRRLVWGPALEEIKDSIKWLKDEGQTVEIHMVPM
ncbi:hypothetical protein LCGC14_3151070, partial [marine sediment metagenome]